MGVSNWLWGTPGIVQPAWDDGAGLGRAVAAAMISEARWSRSSQLLGCYGGEGCLRRFRPGCGADHGHGQGAPGWQASGQVSGHDLARVLMQPLPAALYPPGVVHSCRSSSCSCKQQLLHAYIRYIGCAAVARWCKVSGVRRVPDRARPRNGWHGLPERRHAYPMPRPVLLALFDHSPAFEPAATTANRACRMHVSKVCAWQAVLVGGGNASSLVEHWLPAAAIMHVLLLLPCRRLRLVPRLPPYFPSPGLCTACTAGAPDSLCYAPQQYWHTHNGAKHMVV